MANNDWEDDDSQDQNNAPKALRDHAKKLEKELADERAKTATLTAQVRTNAISGVLQTQGYNPKIASLIPETVDATEDKLNEWLTQNADLFPKAPPQAEMFQPDGTSGGDDTDQDAPDQADDRMGRAASMSLPVARARELEVQIASAKSSEEMDRLMGQLSNVRFK